MSPRPVTLRRRPARALPSALVCLAVLLVVGYLIWAMVVRLADGQWPEPIATAVPAILETPLSHPGVLTAAIIATVLGVILLLCAILPGRYRHSVLRLDESLYPGSQETVLTHRGLANIVRTRTSRLDGVGSVSSKVTGRRVELAVRTPLHETGEVTERVRAKAEDTIGRIPFVQPPTVTTRTGRSRR